MPKTILPRIAVLEDKAGYVENDIKQIKEDIREIKNKLDDGYLKKADFIAVKNAADLIDEDQENRLKYLEEYRGIIKTTFWLYGIAIGGMFTVILYLIFRHS